MQFDSEKKKIKAVTLSQKVFQTSFQPNPNSVIKFLKYDFKTNKRKRPK